MRWSFGLLVGLVISTGAQARPRVAVVTFEAAEPSLEAIAATSTEQLLTALAGTGRVDTIGARDVTMLLGIERQRQLLGCQESSCMTEIAAALGAPWLIGGSVGRVGTAIRLDLRVVRAVDGSVVHREGVTVDASRLSDVAVTLADGIVEVVAPRPARLVRVGAWVTAGLGVGAAVAGGVMLASASGLRSELQSRPQLRSYEQTLTAISEVNARTIVGSALLAAGGVAVLAGLLWQFAVPEPASVTVLPTANGLVVAW